MTTVGKRTPVLPNGLKSETGNFMHENEFNRAVVANLDIILKRCGFRTLLVAPTDEDVPLKTRTDLANAKKADAFISIHANAFDGKFDGNDPEGIETFHYPSSTNGKRLATLVHNHLIKGTKQKNRGVKSANLHVLRETKMVAILVEAGFMDNLYEAKLLLSDSFREEVATEIAKGICEYFNVPYVPKKEVIQMPNISKPGNNVPSSWAQESWNWAKQVGLLDGTRPKDPITREEMAVVLKRLVDKRMI